MILITSYSLLSVNGNNYAGSLYELLRYIIKISPAQHNVKPSHSELELCCLIDTRMMEITVQLFFTFSPMAFIYEIQVIKFLLLCRTIIKHAIKRG